MLWKYPSKATAWVLGSFPTSIPEDEKMLKILTTISRNFVAWVALGCDRMLAKFQVFHLWKVTLHKPNTSHCKKKKIIFKSALDGTFQFPGRYLFQSIQFRNGLHCKLEILSTTSGAMGEISKTRFHSQKPFHMNHPKNMVAWMNRTCFPRPNKSGDLPSFQHSNTMENRTAHHVRTIEQNNTHQAAVIVANPEIT